MIRRPPRSTLFPTRRSSDLCCAAPRTSPTGSPTSSRRHRRAWRPPSSRRSEEHTSELQSLAYLVCRLLLEKKNHILLAFLLRTHCLVYALVLDNQSHHPLLL